MNVERRIDRRKFLKRAAQMTAIVGSTAVSAPRAVRAATEKVIHDTINGKKIRNLGMVLDLRKCVGCSACHVACKSENKVPLGVYRTWVKIVDKGTFPNLSRQFEQRLCMHCRKPPCERNCPTGATYIDENSAVLIRYDRCIGCGMCVSSCPYRARYMNPETNTADKCTFCMHKVVRGELPACVDACRYGVRIFGDLDDPESEISKIIATEPVQQLSPERGTGPKVYYIGLDELAAETTADPEEVKK